MFEGNGNGNGSGGDSDETPPVQPERPMEPPEELTKDDKGPRETR